jgi:predicted DNA-binding protein
MSNEKLLIPKRRGGKRPGAGRPVKYRRAVHITLRPEIDEAVQEAAQAHKVSKSDFVEQAIERHLPKELWRRRPEGEKLPRRVLSSTRENCRAKGEKAQPSPRIFISFSCEDFAKLGVLSQALGRSRDEVISEAIDAYIETIEGRYIIQFKKCKARRRRAIRVRPETKVRPHDLAKRMNLDSLSAYVERPH